MRDVEPPDVTELASDLEQLSGFRDSGAPGWTRTVFSEPYRASRPWLHRRMTDAGLDVRIDDAGNIIGRLPGRRRGPALVTGSHTDTVHGGGRFDGTIGVLGALAAVRSLRSAGVELAHDLVIVDFLGEEPNEFGLSCVGSRAVNGTLTPVDLELRDRHGIRLGDALRGAGRGEDVLRAAWEPKHLAAYVELHIEQGPNLEMAGLPLGVVTGIVGVHRFTATFRGRRDHAGTMPMQQRRDAAAAAAAVTLAVEEVASSGPGVGTTGRLEVSPGFVNIVPDHAQMWSELRSPDERWLDAACDAVVNEIRHAGSRRRVETHLEWLSREAPIESSGVVTNAISTAIGQVGYQFMRLPSGAEHDAAKLARLGPMGMIFVPSKDGRSHCPEEHTDLEDIGKGVHVLARTLQVLDREMA